LRAGVLVGLAVVLDVSRGALVVGLFRVTVRGFVLVHGTARAPLVAGHPALLACRCLPRLDLVAAPLAVAIRQGGTPREPRSARPAEMSGHPPRSSSVHRTAKGRPHMKPAVARGVVGREDRRASRHGAEPPGSGSRSRVLPALRAPQLYPLTRLRHRIAPFCSDDQTGPWRRRRAARWDATGRSTRTLERVSESLAYYFGLPVTTPVGSLVWPGRPEFPESPRAF